MKKNERSPENENAFKHLFGEKLLKRLSDQFSLVYPSFDRKRFLNLASPLSSLEMKQRVRLIRDELKRQLPEDYKIAVGFLTRVGTQGNVSIPSESG
jgi:hypothetical protein